MIRRTYLPDEITLPCGARLVPVIGGHIGQVPFITKEHTGIDVTRNGWGNDLHPGQENNAIISEARRRGLKFRRVYVLSRNLRGKLDLYGRKYSGTHWVFVEQKCI